MLLAALFVVVCLGFFMFVFVTSLSYICLVFGIRLCFGVCGFGFWRAVFVFHFRCFCWCFVWWTLLVWVGCCFLFWVLVGLCVGVLCGILCVFVFCVGFVGLGVSTVSVVLFLLLCVGVGF